MFCIKNECIFFESAFFKSGTDYISTIFITPMRNAVFHKLIFKSCKNESVIMIPSENEKHIAPESASVRYEIRKIKIPNPILFKEIALSMEAIRNIPNAEIRLLKSNNVHLQYQFLILFEFPLLMTVKSVVNFVINSIHIIFVGSTFYPNYIQ